jgi:hypothetical protein
MIITAAATTTVTTVVTVGAALPRHREAWPS